MVEDSAEQQQQQQQHQSPQAPPAKVAQPQPSNSYLKEQYSEYYRRIFPVQRLCNWLSHGNDSTYLLNREICFTLPGDIFCRFKSFPNAALLQKALVADAPEKIDAGAVYQVPAERRHQTPLVPQERELVFDIDMSDYDTVRSCCKGKSICKHCWPWMATAAHVIRYMVSECFGFTKLLPVFSGRRGIHIWVCDAAARKLSDDDRQAIVSFMNVVHGAQFKVNCAYELQRNALAPALETVMAKFIDDAFFRIFLSPENENCVFRSAKSADVFRAVVESVNQQVPLAALIRDMEFKSNKKNPDGYADRLFANLIGTPGQPMNEQQFNAAVAVLPPGFCKGIEFVLMYPRLDEHVTTRRDHLLKMPLCVHPGTQRLCCPLRFDELNDFDPVADPPTLSGMLASETGVIPEKWLTPLDEVTEKSKK